MQTPFLSVIIPVFNEEKRIAKTLGRLISCLDKTNRLYEVIVMNDGSTDKTQRKLEEFNRFWPNPALRVLCSSTNHGKGYAVKRGIQAAKGDFIFFTDADLSTPPEEIEKFLQIFKKTNAHVLIGSRNVKGAKIETEQPFYRVVMGRIFNFFVKRVTGLLFQDTQCGFKAFRKDPARRIFQSVKQNGFIFDVELLLVAKKLELVVEEVPIVWRDSHQSKINPVSDSLVMFQKLFELRKMAREL